MILLMHWLYSSDTGFGATDRVTMYRRHDIGP